MVDRLVPKYRVFLLLGFGILVFSLFGLVTSADVLIVIWANKFFSGNIDTTFKAAQIADNVINHTLKVLLFVGLSLIKLGIGFAIATIVQHLRATGRGTLDAYASAGVAEAEASGFEEPWFGRYFTRFLFTGILVMLFMFLVALWWDANLVLLKQAEFDGRTAGVAYETYLMTERILDALIVAGKFLGEGLIIFGIISGLATIVTNLSFQTRALPALTRSVVNPTGANEPSEPLRPTVPAALVGLGVIGLAAMLLATPLAIIRAGFISWALGRQFDGSISEAALRVEGILGRVIDPLTSLGLGILFFAITFLLLAIIHWLREQRRGFGEVVSDLSQGSVPRPVVEASLWPERLVPPLAIFGLFVIVSVFLILTTLRGVNFNMMLDLQFVGSTDGISFQNAMRLDRMLAPIIEATRFIGFATIMVGIGLALVVIVVQLRATALLLPMGFSKLVPAARGETPEGDDLSLEEPMVLAPWNMLRPLLVGAAIMVSTTLPIVILHAVSIHRMLAEQFAGLGGQGAASGLFKSSFLAANLFGASQLSWMLFGMGLVLFAIGRFFATIVTFVQTRRAIVVEGTSAIGDAVAAGRSS